MRGSWRREGRPCEDAEKRKKVRAHAQGCGRWVCGLRNEKEVLVYVAVMAVTWRHVRRVEPGETTVYSTVYTERRAGRGLRASIVSRAPGRATMIIPDETPRTATSALLAELEREDAALEASMRPTVEEERAIMAATQQQAAEHGDWM